MFGKRKGNQKAETTGAAEAAVPRVLGCPLPKWARRFGAAAFLFFLIKGLVVWVLLPAALVLWAWLSGD